MHGRLVGFCRRIRAWAEPLRMVIARLRPALLVAFCCLLLPSAPSVWTQWLGTMQREAQLRQIAIAPSTCCTKQLATATRIALFIGTHSRRGYGLHRQSWWCSWQPRLAPTGWLNVVMNPLLLITGASNPSAAGAEQRASNRYSAIVATGAAQNRCSRINGLATHTTWCARMCGELAPGSAAWHLACPGIWHAHRVQSFRTAPYSVNYAER